MAKAKERTPEFLRIIEEMMSKRNLEESSITTLLALFEEMVRQNERTEVDAENGKFNGTSFAAELSKVRTAIISKCRRRG